MNDDRQIQLTFAGGGPGMFTEKDDPLYREPFSNIYDLELSSSALQFLTQTLRVDVRPILNICEPYIDTGVSSTMLHGFHPNQKYECKMI